MNQTYECMTQADIGFSGCGVSVNETDGGDNDGTGEGSMMRPAGVSTLGLLLGVMLFMGMAL